jgi:hypothetical protein
MALKMATRRTRTELDDLIIRALTPPVFLGLLGLGLWLALTRLSELQPHTEIINKSFVVITILLRKAWSRTLDGAAPRYATGRVT